MQNVPDTAWRPAPPETQHIGLSVSITLASITVQNCCTLMQSFINWHAPSWIYWFFSWALGKYCALVWTPKFISMFTKYCHWNIWITSALTRFVFKISFDVFLPCLYSVSYLLICFAFIVHVLLYIIFWTILIKSTPNLPLPSKSVSISSSQVRLVFPIISFPLLLYTPFQCSAYYLFSSAILLPFISLMAL
jgi:hypothetical protein